MAGCRPAPEPVLGGPPEVVETHSAIVFFVGDRAYKLKKPVDLGFLDFRSRRTREVVCHREVELNRRLAPDVYLGVADVLGPDGSACDHLVVMRRLPVGRRLSSLVLADAPVERHLWQLAHRLAALHAGSPRSRDADLAAGVAATRSRWDASTETMIRMGGCIFDDVSLGRVHGLACRYLDGRVPLFARRVADGRGVDGHGDLLADDIFCLEDGPRALDCIEFDDSLRLGDGLSDAAFLAMDLERLGRPDLGRFFLDAYRDHRGDSWPSSLAHHHIAYRAHVRAKVAGIRSMQGAPGADGEARRLLDLAAAHLEAGRVRLVLVGGPPGSGKSTIAGSIATQQDAVLFRSDEVRKELAGLPADQKAPAAFGDGIYTTESTSRTYDELIRRAALGLTMGESIVLDATFTDAAWRERARAVARLTSSDLVELRCEVSEEVAAARIRRRSAAGHDPSDATPEIASRLTAAADPWPEAATVSTEGDPTEVLGRALRHVRRPAA